MSNKKYELRDGRWRCKRLLFCCTKKFCVLAFKRIQNFPRAHIVCKRWRRSIAKFPPLLGLVGVLITSGFLANLLVKATSLQRCRHYRVTALQGQKWVDTLLVVQNSPGKGPTQNKGTRSGQCRDVCPFKLKRVATIPPQEKCLAHMPTHHSLRKDRFDVLRDIFVGL